MAPKPLRKGPIQRDCADLRTAHSPSFLRRKREQKQSIHVRTQKYPASVQVPSSLAGHHWCLIGDRLPENAAILLGDIQSFGLLARSVSGTFCTNFSYSKTHKGHHRTFKRFPGATVRFVRSRRLPSGTAARGMRLHLLRPPLSMLPAVHRRAPRLYLHSDMVCFHPLESSGQLPRVLMVHMCLTNVSPCPFMGVPRGKTQGDRCYVLFPVVYPIRVI